jgi:hypothetical protein
MSLLDPLRKGFCFLLLCMGVSAPAKKPPAPDTAVKPGPGKP